MLKEGHEIDLRFKEYQDLTSTKDTPTIYAYIYTWNNLGNL
jgi:hypothetical protein